MTSIQTFRIQQAISNASAAISGSCTPQVASKLLAACHEAYASDVAQYGEAAVKRSAIYPQLVAVQGELEVAAAGAVRRASRNGML